MQGKQGVGKSAFLKRLLPTKEHSRWFSSSLKLNEERQKQIESIEGAAIVEISELGGLKRADLNAVKDFMTDDQMRGRKVWARKSPHRPRNFALALTTNERMPLPNDSSGNRRFVMIRLLSGPGKKPRAKHDIDLWFEKIVNDDGDSRREQIWAEVKYRILELKEKIALPDELFELQSELNQEYRYRDSSVENALDDRFPDGIAAPGLAIEELAEELKMLPLDANGKPKPLKQLTKQTQDRLMTALESWAAEHGWPLTTDNRERAYDWNIRKALEGSDYTERSEAEDEIRLGKAQLKQRRKIHTDTID